METMKYKVGDKVRIKDIDWYNENKDEYGNVPLVDFTKSNYNFNKRMRGLCGKVVTISRANKYSYDMVEDNGVDFWTDEMIEGLVEEKSKYGTASYAVKPKSNANCITQERVDELATKIDKEPPSRNQNVWELPDGYQFVDEDGNVINVKKIALEKKKTKYPKTYEECCKVLGYDDRETYCVCHTGANERLFEGMYRLKVCRDAYWKLAGDEMGLNRPWEPSDSDYITGRYCIFVHQGNIICSTPAEDCPLTFPTEEMRDTFYNNFKEEIEMCKTLL